MKPSLGMIVHTQKVMPILSSVLVLIGFSDLVCQDQPQGHPSWAPLGAFGTLGVPPRLIPPHSVRKPYTNSPSSSIVTLPPLFVSLSSHILVSLMQESDLKEGKSASGYVEPTIKAEAISQTFPVRARA